MTGAYRRPSRSSHRLITSDDPCKSLAQGEVRYFASMLDVAKAFAKTPEPYKQIVYDDGCEVRHLNRDETWTGVRLRLPRPRRRGGRLMPIRLVSSRGVRTRRRHAEGVTNTGSRSSANAPGHAEPPPTALQAPQVGADTPGRARTRPDLQGLRQRALHRGRPHIPLAQGGEPYRLDGL